MRLGRSQPMGRERGGRRCVRKQPAEELENLFRRSDVISLHCPLTPETEHLVNEERLAWMKPTAFLLNTSRGPLIDETALVSALQSGRVHSAALDVMEVEPLSLDSPLRGFDRCIFGSHNGSNTVDAVVRASERAIELLFALLQGRSAAGLP